VENINFYKLDNYNVFMSSKKILKTVGKHLSKNKEFYVGAALLGLTAALDMTYTIHGLSTPSAKEGLISEANPVMSHFIGTYGMLEGLVLAKTLFTVLLVGVSLKIKKPTPLYFASLAQTIGAASWVYGPLLF